MSISTNQTPVRYGARYLDAAQAERQQASIDNVPTSIYGAAYLADGPRAAVAALPAEEPKEPAQYTIKQLHEVLALDNLATNPDALGLALSAEAHRRNGPRKTALGLLYDAAVALQKTELAETITALLGEPGAVVQE